MVHVNININIRNNNYNRKLWNMDLETVSLHISILEAATIRPHSRLFILHGLDEGASFILNMVIPDQTLLTCFKKCDERMNHCILNNNNNKFISVQHVNIHVIKSTSWNS